MEMNIGQVKHFFNHLSVAVVILSHKLELSDTIHFLGHDTDFYQQVWSMEVNHRKVLTAEPATEVALKVAEPVREGDRVLLVPKEEAAFDELNQM